jgi:hypothetical protein
MHALLFLLIMAVMLGLALIEFRKFIEQQVA